MDNHVFKALDLVGTSSTSIEDAVNKAIERAGGTVRNIRWFEIQQVRGAVDKGKVSQWQVQLRLGFALEE